MKYRNIIIIALILMCCPMLFAAQLKDTTITGNGTVTGNLKVTGTATVTNLKDLSVVTTATNPNMNVGTGVITTAGIETIVTFNASSTFVVPDGVTSLKVLVVGGGAGGDGGVSSAVYGHGGGGGRVTYRSAFGVTGGSSYTVTIGTGGASGAMDNQASDGVQSAFGTITAAGGTKANNIGTGGDGGDSGNDIDTVVTNYNGLTDTTWGAAGGAGAGGVGGTVTDAAGGTGGVGYSSSITGSSTAYGTGGDGSGTGSGAPSTIAANRGLGGHGHATSPRSGGSGVVIVRFITTYATVTVNDKFHINNNGRVVVGGTVANNSLTVINPNVNGVAIDLRSDDTNLNGNNYSVARLLADFTSTSYADSRLYLQTATGGNAWKTGLTIKDGKAGIGTSTPATELHVVGTVTATGFSGNGAGLTGKENTLSNSAGLASAISDETGTNTVVFSSGSTQTNATFTGNSNFPGSGIWNSSGNVGIGTVSPGTRLEIMSAQPTGIYTETAAGSRMFGNLNIQSTDAYTTQKGGRITFSGEARSSGAFASFAAIQAKKYNALDANSGGNLEFLTGRNADGLVSVKMVIDESGNVGIGTTGPVSPLNVKPSTNIAQLFLEQDNPASGAAGWKLFSHSDISGDLAFLSRQASTDTELVRFKQNGNVGIGTTTPAAKLHLYTNTTSARGEVRLGASTWDSDNAGYNLTWYNGYDQTRIISQIAGVQYPSTSAYMAFSIGPDTLTEAMRIIKGGNVGIGTTTPNNILTLPIASATDPIADSWTNHCLADYKEIGTETAEMVQDSANDIVKNTPVSIFTKKAIIADEEAEREPKQKYQDKIKESAKADLELYTAETGVAVNNNSYIDELVNSMWETKADRLAIVEANKQILISEKKALPKFQRKNYGIVAEDAPPEAQVLRKDGGLQGVDPSVLIGILWANAQKQEARIAALESEITNLKQRLQSAGIP